MPKQSLADHPNMPRIGQMVCDRYRVHEVLGEGGFAVVYRAHDLKLSGDIALKILAPEQSDEKDFLQRFQQEVKLIRQLRHHNTIKLFDAGTTEAGYPYLAMEFFEGEALDHILATQGPMSVDRVVRIITQVLKSLSEAHSTGIVHRDIKPGNIKIGDLDGEEDYVKLLDFGTAKPLEPEMARVKTRTGMLICTPSYAAPELFRGEQAVPASDLYALGLIMVEMLTGQTVVTGHKIYDIAAAHMGPQPIPLPPKVSQSLLVGVITKATAKPLGERYGSAKEMLDDLKRIEHQILLRNSGQVAAYQPPPNQHLAPPPVGPPPQVPRTAEEPQPFQRQPFAPSPMPEPAPNQTSARWPLALVALLVVAAAAVAAIYFLH